MCAERSPLILGWTCCPVSLLCFVISYFQRQVTESRVWTSSNNKEWIMSPNKKPGGWVVLDRCPQQVSVSQALPACWAGSPAAQLPSGLQEGCHLTALLSPTGPSRHSLRACILCFLRSCLSRLPFASHRSTWVRADLEPLPSLGKGEPPGICFVAGFPSHWGWVLTEHPGLRLSWGVQPQRVWCPLVAVLREHWEAGMVLGRQSQQCKNLLSRFSDPTPGLLNQTPVEGPAICLNKLSSWCWRIPKVENHW